MARLKAGGTAADSGTLADTASTVSDGAVADDVVQIQRGLARLGLYDGPVDGIAGPRTREAITRYQEREGLPATGLPSIGLKLRLMPKESGG
jgi:peptidoglycan hydrolase-like protein with peptidoglycan-binding domain